ncbi:MAG: site-2 protease family protein [Sedimentisphaerales bacterium]|nr:site-2 protease family protein [Sedimentisphaerales bacterium]
MSEKKDFFSKYFRLMLFLAVVAGIIYFLIRHIDAFGNVLLVLLGFGAVILVHEFGHFIVAKLSGIKVEAFSIFMPPTLFGIQRIEKGTRFRILPDIFPKEDGEPGEGAVSITITGDKKPSETEYRMGLVPFGGFVKLLGQEDTGSVKSTDDPRSFANKPTSVRAAVLAAGVFCNIISAVIIFMVVFLIGINLPPAVVGGVMPDSPAARAGIKAGDEVVSVAGKSEDLDFSSIGIAAALSGKEEKVPMRIRHKDGTEEDLELVAESLPGGQMREFGILRPESLTIARLSEKGAGDLYSRTGLLAGDRIKSIAGKEVNYSWEFQEAIEDSLVPEVAISVERSGDAGEKASVESQIKLSLMFAGNYSVESESKLYHVYSMVPRLKISGVSGGAAAKPDSSGNSLKAGDIIVAVGDIEYPTYSEMRGVIKEYENRELAVKVLRISDSGGEEYLTVNVRPQKVHGIDRVQIGVALVLDADHPVVAKTVETEGGPMKLDIPRGAVITAVDREPVSSFYDVIGEISKYREERITIDWRVNNELAGNVVLNVGSGGEGITVKSDFAEDIPLGSMERTYKADGPVDAIKMGYRRTVMFVAQTYVTLKRLVGGLVSPKNLMGPVGIITLSYRIVADQPLIYYVYFLGLISAVIAVFNFLPLPPLDGGLVVLLLVEKIKGSALSESVQGAIAYIGWALILTLILYVTFNDIVRNFFS